MQDARQGDVTVELCLRTSAPSVARGRQEAVRERAEALADEGAVAAATTNYWSTRVCVPDDGARNENANRGEDGDASARGTSAPGRGPADRCPRVVGEILAVADEHDDVTVEPYFRSRPSSHDADEEVLFLPVICLLVRDGGDLVGVYPVTKDDRRYTVEDGLDRLESGADPANL